MDTAQRRELAKLAYEIRDASSELRATHFYAPETAMRWASRIESLLASDQPIQKQPDPVPHWTTQEGAADMCSMLHLQDGYCVVELQFVAAKPPAWFTDEAHVIVTPVSA